MSPTKPDTFQSVLQDLAQADQNVKAAQDILADAERAQAAARKRLSKALPSDPASRTALLAALGVRSPRRPKDVIRPARTNDRQRKSRILDMLTSKGFVTVREVIKAEGVTTGAASSALRSLVKEGRAFRSAKGRYGLVKEKS